MIEDVELSGGEPGTNGRDEEKVSPFLHTRGNQTNQQPD